MSFDRYETGCGAVITVGVDRPSGLRDTEMRLSGLATCAGLNAGQTRNTFTGVVPVAWAAEDIANELREHVKAHCPTCSRYLGVVGCGDTAENQTPLMMDLDTTKKYSNKGQYCG